MDEKKRAVASCRYRSHCLLRPPREVMRLRARSVRQSHRSRGRTSKTARAFLENKGGLT